MVETTKANKSRRVCRKAFSTQKNKVELMSSSGIKEANPEDADDNDNETAIAVSLMTGSSEHNSIADFRSSGRSISSSASKGSGSIFGRLRASSGGSHAELDDQLGDSYSDSSGGSYKRYSVWTKLAFQRDGWDDFDTSTINDGEYEDINLCTWLGEVVVGCFSATGRGCMWLKQSFVTAITNKIILLSTLALLACLIVGGVLIVKSYADNEEENNRDEAHDLAVEIGLWFSTELDKAILPLFTMAQFVQQLPEFHSLSDVVGGAPWDPARNTSHRDLTGLIDPELEAKFNEIAAGIKRDAKMDGILVSVQLAPEAVVTLIHPLINYEDFEDFDPPVYLNNTGAVGHDLLNDPNRVAIARATVPSADVVIAGPLTLIQGDFPVVKETLIARLPINMEGQEIILDGVSYPCWGFAVVLINWEVFKERSSLYDRFDRVGMEFLLTRTDQKLNTTTNEYYDTVVTIAESGNHEVLNSDNSVVVPLNTTNNEWILTAGLEGGFRPTYENWAYAIVTCGSFAVASLFALILVSKKEHEQLLFKMMPRKAIAKLRRNETVIERYEMVTIFFSDIVGFTTLAGELAPIEVMSMLNQLYTEFDKLVEKHDVYKVETIGDAYMVLGGAPNKCSGPAGAEKIAKFALDAIRCVQQFRSDTAGQIFIRAGLASGPVVAGVVGTAMPRYCLFGDTVNLASRMESTSRKMQIQCSSITHHLLRDAPNYDFEFEARREGGELGVEVKGKGRQYTYWIRGMKERQAITDQEFVRSGAPLLLTGADGNDDNDEIEINSSTGSTFNRSNLSPGKDEKTVHEESSSGTTQ
mmetsp:Transcript_9703/g.14565  ORF Transcript_9703/g.14565 Transcript_9703/m.14565 type:complete len:812 (-) Transcript_9703:51-2486(-)